MVHARLGEHRVVLDLGLAHGRAVVRDDDELSFPAAEALEGGLEAQGVLSGLDDERQPGVDVLLGLFLFAEWVGVGVGSRFRGEEGVLRRGEKR